MRRSVSLTILTFLLSCVPLRAAGGYYLAGDSSVGWSLLLSALGYQRTSADAASVVVIRPGTSTPGIDWQNRAQQGALVVLEGSSATADQFGFRETNKRVSVNREQYEHDPSLIVIWQSSLQIPVYQIPVQATVYSRDRWSGAPLLAGYHVGSGAVLWAAVDPGASGYDRFPYLPKALQDLGLVLPFASRRLWFFFDYAYRTRVNLDYMASVWRNMGTAGLWVSGWKFEERDPDRDAYLRALIEACHRNGIVIYAWVAFPHVSDKFWNDHPQCREKNALLQDAAVFWRKLVNLTNPGCFRTVANELEDLLLRFDWDGVNLSELYFDGISGIANLRELTPFNDDVRTEVKQKYGFDPVDLFRASSPVHYLNNPNALKQFFQYRRDLLYRLNVQWIQELLGLRAQRPGFAVTVLDVDDMLDPSIGDNLGVDSPRFLKLLDTYDFDYVAEDPSSLWTLGPERYSQMASLFRPLTTHTDRVGVDINIVLRALVSSPNFVSPDVFAFPTLLQTGSELARLLSVSSNSLKKVGIYFEASIVPNDRSLVQASSAALSKFTSSENSITVSSPYGVGVSSPSSALVNGKLWPHADNGVIWLPAGEFRIEPSSEKPPIRLLDFNGNLLDAALVDGALRFRYSGTLRALAIVDRLPSVIRLNGNETTLPISEYKGRYSMVLPPGNNTIDIVPFPIAGAPAVNAGGTVNGASFAAGQPVSPGSIVSIFGTNLATSTGAAGRLPLPGRLAEATVRMNDSLAPLFYASANQLTIQVPWDLAGFSEASVSVTVNGVIAGSQQVKLTSYSPGIFTAGESQGAVLSAGRLADSNNPVKRGEAVSIFCTGLGAVSNTPATGSAASAAPLSLTVTKPSVLIGGVAADVIFSGLAPGFVGVYQVNVTVPLDSPTGDSVSLALSIGGVLSNTVTLAVQ